ncbi:MAG: YCF48-related protein [Candidatus Zixiibacteriota bacterium]
MKFKVLLLAVLILATGCEKKNLIEMKWDKLSAGTTENVTGIFFESDSKGWAVTSAGNILHTEDGCKTWTTHDLGNYYLEDIFFAEDDDGFAVGSDGCLFHTKDGGKTWIDESLDQKIWLYDIGFWDDDEGIIVGVNKTESGSLDGVLLASHDGGDTWQEVYNDMIGMSSLFMRGSQLGWITCTGSVGSTTNGGETWEKNILDDRDVVRGCFFHNAQSGWIVGHGGLLASTNDGGWSWQRKGQLTEQNLYAVGFLSMLEGVAVGENGKMFLTVNSGNSWAIDSNFVKVTLRDIEVVEDRMWICGDDGTIISVHK